MSIIFAAEAAGFAGWHVLLAFAVGVVIGLAILAALEKKWREEKELLEYQLRDAQGSANRLRTRGSHPPPERAALKEKLAKLLRERQLARENLYKLGLEDHALEAKLEMLEEQYIGPINELYEKL